MTALAFLMAAAYRPDRPGNRAAMRRWEWLALLAVVAAMVAAFDEAVR